jgi:hypothetical protein
MKCAQLACQLALSAIANSMEEAIVSPQAIINKADIANGKTVFSSPSSSSLLFLRKRQRK